MGAPQSYYRAFAEHLADRGLCVLTYDYRGTGSLEDWGRHDQSAALEALAALRPRDALAIVGHSLGGQMLGLASNIARVRAGLLVASQTGYWGFWRGPRRARMWLLWWFFIPVLTTLLGRFPGRLLGT